VQGADAPAKPNLHGYPCSYGNIDSAFLADSKAILPIIHPMKPLPLHCLSFLILGSCLFASEGATPEKPKPSPTAYTLDTCVTAFDPAKTEKTAVGYSFWFADRKLANGKTLKLSVVAPKSATHAPHHHPEDEFFFVLEGTAEFYLNGQTRTAGPMTSFYCPSNSEHGIRNVADTTLKYLVVKEYPAK
jgi:quercetin dioxygenase-like cupin family protein